MKGDLIIKLPGLDELNALVQNMKNAVARMEAISATKPIVVDATTDCWLDAESARKYLSDMSKSTFDKYRYQTTPRLKGCKLDGKVLYKRSDIDAFVLLYEDKIAGLS